MRFRPLELASTRQEFSGKQQGSERKGQFVYIFKPLPSQLCSIMQVEQRFQNKETPQSISSKHVYCIPEQMLLTCCQPRDYISLHSGELGRTLLKRKHDKNYTDTKSLFLCSGSGNFLQFKFKFSLLF